MEDARVFDLPGKLPVIAVAASGPVSARIAAELDDGLFATEPDGDLVASWQNLGGSGPAYAEMPLAWAADEDKAAQAVLDKSRFALTGWKVMAELPNPVNFEAATASITADQVKSQFACGPDAAVRGTAAAADGGTDRAAARRIRAVWRPGVTTSADAAGVRSPMISDVAPGSRA